MKTRTGRAVPFINQCDTCDLVQKWFLVCWGSRYSQYSSTYVCHCVIVSLECDIMRHLLMAQLYLQHWQFLPSLLQLNDAHTKLTSLSGVAGVKEVGGHAVEWRL